MPQVTIEFTHPKGNFIPPEGEVEECTEEIEIDLGYEPPDSAYGADADGNRGMYVAGYFYPETDPPTKCERCGHEYTEEERTEMEKVIEQRVNEYSEDGSDYDYDEPDYPED